MIRPVNISGHKSRRFSSLILGCLPIFFAVAWSGGQIYGQTLTAIATYRWASRIDGMPIWVTEFAPKRLITQDVPKGWYEAPISNGETYLIATGRATNVRVAIDFTPDHQKAEALFYEGSNLPNNVLALAQAGTLSQMPPTIRVATKNGGWLVHGKTNYSIQYQNFSGQRLISESVIGSSKPGIPSWQTTRTIFNPHPTYGIPRFGAEIRLPGSPAVALQSSFFKGFPLFGVGTEQTINWFVNNSSPFFLNLNTGQVEENSAVGFEDGGVYRFNSLTYPPYVDFESPFAFYTFTHSRNAELVVRAQQFPVGDPFGPLPANIQRSYFRLSWKMGNTGVWSYSVSVQGFHAYHSIIRLGKTSISAPLPSVYPQWVSSKVWPYVTFVQSMAGYPGSEGIYFDSGGSAPPVWPWLAGFSLSPPRYLVNPYLQQKAVLSHVTSMALPTGFRMESNSAATKKPLLYVSLIDDLVHLVGAQSGIWNLGHHRILREENLTGGNYIDAWILEKISKSVKPLVGGTAIESVYAVPPYLIYLGKRTLIIKKASEALSDFTIDPPTNRKSWLAFTRRVAPYQTGRDPQDLSSWLSGFRGLASTVKNAILIGSPRVQGNDFSVVIHLTRTLDPSVRLSGLAVTEIGPDRLRSAGKSLLPGIYVLDYNKNSGWTIRSATMPTLSAKVSTAEPIRSLRTNALRITVANHGTSQWYGTVSVSVRGDMVGNETGWLNGSSAKTFDVNWSPRSGGQQEIVVRADHKVIEANDVSVVATSRGTVWSLWPLSVPQGTPVDGMIDALVGILIVGGSVVTWRRLTLG